jgi:hypothetical protein
MGLQNGIIRTDARGAINTAHALTILPSVEAVMAKSSLSNPPSKIKVCSIEGCTHKVNAHGYCATHYSRVKKYGDPYFTKVDTGVGNTPEERFWSRVKKTDTCWLWQGKGRRGDIGYGAAYYNRRCDTAHRVAWIITYDQEPKGLLLHSCDIPLCVNPAHLREGTQKENIRDRDERGRTARGERSGNSKLTATQVLDIRRRFAAGEGVMALARAFGIGKTTVGHIVYRRAWRHI